MSAKSRLSTEKLTELTKSVVTSKEYDFPHIPKHFQVDLLRETHERKSRVVEKKHYIHLLFIALPGYLILYYQLSSVSPKSISSILFPQSYLPLLIPLFWSIFFTFVFLVKHTKLGLFLSLLVVSAASLQLQGVQFSVASILLCLIISVLFTLLVSI